MSIRKEDTLNSIDIALLIGTLLNIINQFQPLISLDPAALSISKLVLTYLVPFFVLLYSFTIFHSETGHEGNRSKS